MTFSLRPAAVSQSRSSGESPRPGVFIQGFRNTTAEVLRCEMTLTLKNCFMVSTRKSVDGYAFRDSEPLTLEDPRIKDIIISEATRRRYAKILLDIPFKMVFGQPASAKTMIELLECLIPERKIKEIAYLDKEIPGFLLEEKRTIFDIYCKDDQDRRFIIEMQLRAQDYFTERALFYSTYPVREQIITPLEEQELRKEKKGKKINSYRLCPVYVINIVDFELKHSDTAVLQDGILSRYSIRSDYDGELMTDALHFIFLELPRLPYRRDGYHSGDAVYSGRQKRKCNPNRHLS